MVGNMVPVFIGKCLGSDCRCCCKKAEIIRVITADHNLLIISNIQKPLAVPGIASGFYNSLSDN